MHEFPWTLSPEAHVGGISSTHNCPWGENAAGHFCPSEEMHDIPLNEKSSSQSGSRVDTHFLLMVSNRAFDGHSGGALTTQPL